MINISSYALAVILNEGQQSNFAEENYGTVCGNVTYSFNRKAVGSSYRIEVQVYNQPILYIELKRSKLYRSLINDCAAVDAMLAFTNGDLSMLPAYLHNFPTQRMLYAFVHNDVFSLAQWRLPTHNDYTFILDGATLSCDYLRSAPRAEIKKFNDKSYRANQPFIEIIKALTLPMIIIEHEGYLDDILRAIGAKLNPMSICSDISTHTLEDMLRTL